MNRKLAVPIVTLLVLALPVRVSAGGDAKGLKDQTSLTKHSVTIAGAKIDYEATAGTLVLKEEDGKATASIFYIAYTRPGADLAKRPITFCFNGGPGSSSVWLHLGAFGPKRVKITEAGDAPPPPARLVPNEDSILDLTDLVFVDPVSTGFSRAADEKNAKQFHGVDEDIGAVGQFIRLYTTRHNRWQSPKFLAGESYGTTRAANLVNHMQNRHGMSFNGVVLISTVLNFQTIRFEEGNDLPHILFLPSYAATAWYHKRLDDKLQADLRGTLDQAERFAQGPYAQALMKGNKLGEKEAEDVTRAMARLTGLSEAYIRRSHLRVQGQRFMRELLRDQGTIIGRFDGRITARDGNDVAERPDFDPSYAAVQGPYTGALNQYVRGELRFESDLNYEILTGRVQPWNYGRAATNRYLNVAPALREAMTKNPYLRVFQASGYYDLATPYLATDYTFSHLGGNKELPRRVTTAYYEGGHMMYTHLPSLHKLRADLVKFLEGK
jgi:carboxypeptidase C (cathepsin A)